MSRLALAAGCTAAFLSLGAAADGGGRWYTQFDNDVLASDRWYSSGLRIAHVTGDGERRVEWGVLQEIYTPEAKHYAFGVIDRQPAARLLLVHARHGIEPSGFETLEIAAGVRGPSALGRQATEAVHRIIGAREVDWSLQGNDRFDGSLAWTRSDMRLPVTLHYGGVAGTQVAFAHATLELRMGQGARPISSPILRYVSTPPVADTGAAGFSAFVAAGARVIARNRLLDKGYDPLAPDPDLNRVVGRLSGGLAWAGPCAGVSFAVAFDSREFESQRRPHAFGSLTVHFDF